MPRLRTAGPVCGQIHSGRGRPPPYLTTILSKPEAGYMTTSQAPAVIRVQDLGVGYRNNVVLHDLDLSIGTGECVAVTGNNGSGKSTLLKALIGTIPLMHGSIDLLGYKRYADKESAGNPPWYKVGYVPQRLASEGGIESTVQEVVQSGLLGTGHLRPPRDSKARVNDALKLVGMLHRLKEPFQNLSGGQQQRVLIARALVRNPQLILLDEPLTGLDEHNRIRLGEILAERKAEGCTAVIVLHELGELRPLISREIRIAGGHIVHDGPCTHARHDDGPLWWDHGLDEDGERYDA